MVILKLKTSDEVIVEVDKEVMKCSDLIQRLLKKKEQEENPEEALSLPNIDSANLKKIIQWAVYHKDDLSDSESILSESEQNNANQNVPYIMDPWDASFMDIDHDHLKQLLNSANYLCVEGLIILSCKAIANMFQGQTLQEVRDTFIVE